MVFYLTKQGEGCCKNQNSTVDRKANTELRLGQIWFVCLFSLLVTFLLSLSLSEWNILVDCLGIQFLDRIILCVIKNFMCETELRRFSSLDDYMV